MSEKLRIDLTVLLPEMDDGDRCIELLTERLGATHAASSRRTSSGPTVRQRSACTISPTCAAVAEIERITRNAGATLTEQYRHERLPVIGMNTADAASTLEGAMRSLDGVQHVSVNYPAAAAFVAYDTQVIHPRGHRADDTLLRLYDGSPAHALRVPK